MIHSSPERRPGVLRCTFGPALEIALLLATMGLVLHACRSTFPTSTPTPSLPALAALRSGEDARRAGHFEKAAQEYRRAIELDPWLTEAHRQLQNHELAHCRRAEVVTTYRDLVLAHPDSAVAYYLFGRLLADPAAQEDAFRECVRLDPRYAWGYYGLGFSRERAGDRSGALAVYGRALDVDPAHTATLLRMAQMASEDGDGLRAMSLLGRAANLQPEEAEIHLALGGALLRENRHGAALRSALQAVHFAPWSSTPFEMVDELLPRATTAFDLVDIAEALDDILREGREISPRYFLTRARVAIQLGDPAHARMLLEDGLRRGGDPLDFSECLRDAALLLRDYAGALAAWRSRIPDSLVLDPRSLWRDRFAELIRALEDPDSGPQASLARAHALERVGWLSGAAQEYRFYLHEQPGDDAVASELAALEAHRRFLRRLETEVRRGYRSFEEEMGSLSIDGFLDRVDELARANLGRGLKDGLQITRFPWIGSLVVPGFETESALSREFDRYGQILVVGKQAGGPPEAQLATALQVIRDRRVDLGRGDRDPRYTRVLLDEVLVPSYREFVGSRIGGMALGPWMTLGFDVLLQWQREANLAVRGEFETPSDLLDLGFEPVGARTRPAIVGDGACVQRKLYLRAYQERSKELGDRDPFEQDWQMMLGVVEAHEYGHLLDYHRFVPISHHLWRALLTFVDLGLSKERVESWLEENAQIVSMAIGPSPYAALAQTVTSTLAADDSPPHSLAYHRVTLDLVQYLRAHIEEFPALDPHFELVQQLHRLQEDEIRKVARALAARRGLALRVDAGDRFRTPPPTAR